MLTISAFLVLGALFSVASCTKLGVNTYLAPLNAASAGQGITPPFGGPGVPGWPRGPGKIGGGFLGLDQPTYSAPTSIVGASNGFEASEGGYVKHFGSGEPNDIQTAVGHLLLTAATPPIPKGILGALEKNMLNEANDNDDGVYRGDDDRPGAEGQGRPGGHRGYPGGYLGSTGQEVSPFGSTTGIPSRPTGYPGLGLTFSPFGFSSPGYPGLGDTSPTLGFSNAVIPSGTTSYHRVGPTSPTFGFSTTGFPSGPTDYHGATSPPIGFPSPTPFSNPNRPALQFPPGQPGIPGQIPAQSFTSSSGYRPTPSHPQRTLSI